MIDRETFLTLFNAAKAADRPDYARSLANDWLAAWPADGEVILAAAGIEIEQKFFGTAVERLQSSIERDPEDVRAYKLLATAAEANHDPVNAAIYRACASALSGQMPDRTQAPGWTQAVAEAIQALAGKQSQQAADWAHDAILADPSLPLPTLLAARSSLALGDRANALRLARAGLDRWPGCVGFRYWLADEQIRKGEVDRGVENLHRCVISDPTGELASRFIGADHPYTRLWPDKMRAPLSRPVPADVSAVLGENQLGGTSSGTTKSTPDTDPPSVSPDSSPQGTGTAEVRVDGMPAPKPWEAYRGPNPGTDARRKRPDLSAVLQEIRNEFGRLAQRVNARPQGPNVDARAPAYIVVSSKTRLLQESGEDGFARVDEAIDKLVAAVRKRPGWSAHKIYVDEPGSLKPFGLSPVDPSNAWQVKLRLADLDRSLADQEKMIGALLIIGGDSIIPFHKLPNPTDDEDDEVPSDNPYATTDENYFAPEWSVGRLPSDQADLLSKQLRTAAAEHELAAKPAEPMADFRRWLEANFGKFFGIGSNALGYTASVWKRSSIAVFKSIGEPGSMLASPPVASPRLPTHATKPTTLSYYNLHGLEDAPEWYGQRDPIRDRGSDEEFPVALRIDDVVNSGRAPKIVFTEACYGASVIGKSPESALALRFLDKGSHAVVGSTKVSYGSVTPPLIAADLLGLRFYENINSQLPVGEALRRAKLSLASEMHKRQGYLDGEDQKALISFVLYGDPLYAPRHVAAAAGKKAVMRRSDRPKAMKTACALGGPTLQADELDGTAQQRVKSIVSRYLPGMTGASCTIHHQHHGCDADDHTCPSHQLGIKGLPQHQNGALVVTLSKQTLAGQRQHPHYARLTMDGTGKVLKLAVSR
jgi:Flp pilus assembly protein TadD